MDVVGGRLPAHEDDVVAGLAALLGRVGIEDDRSGGRPRGGVQPVRGDLDLRLRVDHRVQELVELGGVDARDRLLPADQHLVDHVDSDPQRGGGRALPRSRLQQIEHALLHGEFDVLHVAVAGLESFERLRELLELLGHPLAHALDGLGSADSGDNVLSLGVGKELRVEAALSRRGVTGEADAGARPVPAVPEDHLHDVHRRAEVIRDVVRAAVNLRPWRVP